MKESGYRCRLLFIMFALFSAFLPAEAAPKNRPRPAAGRTVTLPDAGIKIRMVPNTELQMLPPLRSDAARKSDGTPVYRVHNLWRHSQLLAIWNGKEVAAILASVKFPPVAKPSRFVMSDETSKWTPYDRIPDEDELRRWAELFTGENVTEITKLAGMGDFSWRKCKTQKPEMCLYFGQGKNNSDPQMLFLLFQWQEDADSRSREWNRLADSCALSVRAIPRSSAGSAAAAPSSESAQDPYYAERLAQAKKSIEGMRGWYIRETPNYIFVSNQRSRNDIKRLQSNLEAARTVFLRYFPPEKERSCVGVVKLFNHREEFLRYPGAEEWQGGFWYSGTRELVISPLDPGVDDRTNDKFIRQTTLHEGFHQYIFYASNEIDPALWFNEGCAQFFQYSDPRRGEIGNLEKDTEALLVAAVDRADADLARYLSLGHEQFYAEKVRIQNYALAHALMYYLLRGAPANGDKDFAAIPQRYVEALRKTRDLDEARKIAFKGIDTRKLSSRLKQFWHDKRQIRKARLKK